MVKCRTMSRATHDAACTNCGFQGKVNDEVIFCPECGQSIEGVAITGEVFEAMLERIRSKNALFEVSPKKEVKY